jgi:hypothetical protein
MASGKALRILMGWEQRSELRKFFLGWIFVDIFELGTLLDLRKRQVN